MRPSYNIVTLEKAKSNYWDRRWYWEVEIKRRDSGRLMSRHAGYALTRHGALRQIGLHLNLWATRIENALLKYWTPDASKITSGTISASEIKSKSWPLSGHVPEPVPLIPSEDRTFHA